MSAIRPPRRIPLPGALRGRASAAVTRVHYRPGASYDPHRHDFAEVFWIEEGEAVHRGADGEPRALGPGSVVFMRPDDVHAFATPSGRGFTMVNVVFHARVLDELRKRYGAGESMWPWPTLAASPLPVTARLDRRALAEAQDWAEALSRRPDRLALDGLLIHLLRQVLARPAARRGNDPAPPWLERAILAFGEPARLPEGVAGFARLAGRSVAHVNREVRRHRRQTTTDLVNDLRLDHAARRLRMGDEPILGISLECGFESLAHFYRLFRRAHGMTPRRYRVAHQGLGKVGWT